MDIINELISYPIVRILLAFVVGYIGFKAAAKVIKFICILAIGFIFLKTIGLL